MKINGTPTENLERILQAEETTPIDLGCVSWVEEGQKEQKIFAISSGLGLDGVHQERKNTVGVLDPVRVHVPAKADALPARCRLFKLRGLNGVRHGGDRADGPVQAQRRSHAVRRAGLLYRNLCCIRTLIFTLFFEVKCYETQF